MTSPTKKYKALATILLLFSIALNLAPLVGFTISGIVTAELVVEKVALTCTIFVVLIMSIVSWANKIVMRSKIWIIMLGLYFCLDNFVLPIIIIGVTQIVDELIVSPLRNHYRNKYTINKEIDKRFT